jgi:hypothetical protein
MFAAWCWPLSVESNTRSARASPEKPRFGRAGEPAVRARRRRGGVYENVRDRTETYGIVRDRTGSYGIVPNRTRTYGNVQNAFRGKPVQPKQLGLSRGVLGPSGANFGVVFPILASWETSHQRVGCRSFAAHALNLEIRSSKLEGNLKLKARSSEPGEAVVSYQPLRQSVAPSPTHLWLSNMPGRIAHPLPSPATYLVFARKTVTWRVSRNAKSLQGRDQKNLIFWGDFARSPAKVRAQNGGLARLPPGRTRPCRDSQLSWMTVSFLTGTRCADRLRPMMGNGAEMRDKIGRGTASPSCSVVENRQRARNRCPRTVNAPILLSGHVRDGKAI